MIRPSPRTPIPPPSPIPDISVLMTAFNTAPFLAEAIRSVLAQTTHRSWELLLVDDGSTDNTLSIARHFADRHPACIRLLQHPGGRNCGISASRNLALHHARAPITAFLDSDDVWLPHHLETQASLLDRFPSVSMVYANAERWVHHHLPFHEPSARRAWWGSNYLPPLVPPGQSPGVLPPGLLLDWFLADEALVPCICTVLVRTSAARSVGGFVDQFRGLYDDQAFHAKISLRHRILAQDRCTARYRQHTASTCARGNHDDHLRQTERARFLHFLEQIRLHSVAS